MPAGSTKSLMVAAAVTFAIVVAFIFGRYLMFGWESFGYQTGADVKWIARADRAGRQDVARLRFRRAVFTLNVGGHTYQHDVTAVLNSMAAAHAGTTNNGVLTLDAKLNPFSFAINGVNSRDVVPDPTADVWKNATVALAGAARTL